MNDSPGVGPGDFLISIGCGTNCALIFLKLREFSRPSGPGTDQERVWAELLRIHSRDPE